MSIVQGSAHRHGRFLASFAVGVALGALAWVATRGVDLSLLAGADAFCLVYIGLILRLAERATRADLRARAAREDEGLGLILILASLALTVSLLAILAVVNRPGGAGWHEAALALAAVPLGWGMVHTLAAVHYAHLFYGSGARGGGGLVFPETPEPGLWDFLYLAFGIGMTAQVSDVVATGSRMRRVVLVHAVASFFTNTVILALAVNAAMTVWS